MFSETVVASLGAQLSAANATVAAKSIEAVQLREETGEQLRMLRQQLKVGGPYCMSVCIQGLAWKGPGGSCPAP